MSKFDFPNIDTSYWQVKDPQWQAQRKKEWERIALMLKDQKSNKGITACKRYFLTGKLPDWEKMRWWEDDGRHVDLLMLLWLHPSWDEALLKSLRDQYVVSSSVIQDDISAGFNCFLWWSSLMADFSVHHPKQRQEHLLVTGHNELLFNVLFGNLEQNEIKRTYINPEGERQPELYQLPQVNLERCIPMGQWLCVKHMMPINNDMLFQYDLPLEWWYQAVKDDDYFSRGDIESRQRRYIEEAFWRFYNFDTDKEGPGPRTTFVTKMRKILDEREFKYDISQMWQRVKAGEVQPEHPWLK